jgi:hypothetical protein
VHGHALCLKHYRRWQRHGNAETVLITRHDGDAQQRFWAKVDKTATCWNWTGAVGTSGYGNYYVDGKYVAAHRFSFESSRGVPIPDDTPIDHRCHNKICVRPDHLRIATPSQNNQNYQPSSTRNGSGIRGVDWYAPRAMWRARVQHNGEVVYYELFQNLEDAAAAVIVKRNEFHTFNDADRTA